MGTRRSIYALSLSEVQQFTGAVNQLKASGIYDNFIRRHQQAMDTQTPSGSSRNAAHRGPVFLPWHRQSLLEFEHRLQAIVPGISVPYWPWELDATLADPRQALIWTENYMGGNGDSSKSWYIQTGPFKDWRAIIKNASTGQLVARSRLGLIRRLGVDAAASTLPTSAHINDLMTESKYDDDPWNDTLNSNPSFRNRMEGTLRKTGEPNQPRLHNRVHRWVGGDMSVGTSPNDPVFWLHHANVDRLWAQWQANGHANEYLPVSGGPTSHNLNDPMLRLETTGVRPADVLSIAALGYSYE